MAEITKVYGQFKKHSNQMESDLNICVEYDPETDTVDKVIKIWSYNYRDRSITDLTAIFEESLSMQLEEILEEVQWRELYAESKHEAVA